MFANLSKAEKIIMSVIVSILLYGAFTYVFSISVLSSDFTFVTFISCLPEFALWKLLICALGSLFILMQGDGLDIKATKVGDGQYGNARFANNKEKLKIYREVQPGYEKVPGFVVERAKKGSYWKIDASDNNMLLLAPPGAGKTTCEFIPTIEYNGLVNKNTKERGASMLILDCKGQELKTCGKSLEQDGYRVLFLDFRYPLQKL